MITRGPCGSFAAAVVLFAALDATPLLAQEPRDTVALPEVVVTATRYPVAPESVSATLTVLHGDEIRSQGLRFVGDALRQIPGVQVVQGGGFGATTSLFMRGGESDYTKVLIDGVPVNDPGGAFDFGSLTTDNIDRIEILRGPASVLYGSDAMTGVVQIITRRGTGPAAIDASVDAGNYGTVRWGGSARGGTDGVGWSASLSRLTTDGIYSFNNQYRNTVASALLQARAGPTTQASLAVRYQDGEFHFPTDFTGAPVDSNQFNTQRMTTISLGLTQALPSALRAELLLGRNETTRGFDDTPPPSSGSNEFSTSEASIQRNTVDGRLVYGGIAGTTLLGGVAFDDEHEQDFSRSDGAFGPSSDSFEASRTNWGFYLQGTVQPIPHLQINAGGRLDDNERFGDFWTYRVAALGFLTATTRVRASVGKGFKEPAFFDTYSTSPFAKGNPNLRPERSQNYEAGVEQDLAAGHGRNSAKLRDVAGTVVIVDINDECLDACRRRFEGDPRFRYVKTDGATLAGVADASITLVYSFDSMVHFAPEVVRSYLRECRRVLVPGGHGFCHHSNYTGNPDGDFRASPHWRNHMSRELFARYCGEAGLDVVRSDVIDWGQPPDFYAGLDCLTVFRKPVPAA